MGYNTMYMQIDVLDTPNHNYEHSNTFVMVKDHEIDTKFAFVAHLIQRSLPKNILSGGHVGFDHSGDPKGRRLRRPGFLIRVGPGLPLDRFWCF